MTIIQRYPDGRSGLINKRGHYYKNWKVRFFILEKTTLINFNEANTDNNNFVLNYYTDYTCSKLKVYIYIIWRSYNNILIGFLYNWFNYWTRINKFIWRKKKYIYFKVKEVEVLLILFTIRYYSHLFHNK